MKSSRWREYCVLTVVCLASFLLAYFLPTTELLKGMLGFPAVAALFSGLWTLFRDNEAHRKNLEIEQQKQIFNLSVTSHMAEVAFDRYIKFCEEYMQRLMQGLDELIVEKERYEHYSFELKNIRSNHAIWISAEINAELHECEEVWRKYGFCCRTAKETQGDLQNKFSGKASELFDVIHGVGESGGVTTYEKTISIIQGVLGITELTKLRTSLISQAQSALTFKMPK
jgi:hypothetical protein